MEQESFDPSRPVEKGKEKVDSGGGGRYVGIGYMLFVAMIVATVLVLFYGRPVFLVPVIALVASAISFAEIGGRLINRVVLRRRYSP